MGLIELQDPLKSGEEVREVWSMQSTGLSFLLEALKDHMKSVRKKSVQPVNLNPKLQMKTTTLDDTLIYPSETLSVESSHAMSDFWPRQIRR